VRVRGYKGEVASQNSYLTRWNKETEQVELVIGKLHEWPESEARETAG
jgi:hypothetical protein